MSGWRSVHSGAQVVERCRYVARRLLQFPARCCSSRPADRVDARQVVAETFMPGDITPLNLAKLLSMPPADVPDCMLKKEGDRIEAGEAIARTKGIFGKFRTEYKSETAGAIESISAVTGQVIVRGAPLAVQVKPSSQVWWRSVSGEGAHRSRRDVRAGLFGVAARRTALRMAARDTIRS